MGNLVAEARQRMIERQRTACAQSRSDEQAVRRVEEARARKIGEAPLKPIVLEGLPTGKRRPPTPENVKERMDLEDVARPILLRRMILGRMSNREIREAVIMAKQ